MAVERFSYPKGDLLVAEVKPSDLPPVRYRGRVFIRIGPRRDVATESEERILAERRCSFMATFDATPCLNAKLEDLNVTYIKTQYLPMVFDEENLTNDKRNIKEQLASIHLYDRDNDCPTYAGIILFGINPNIFLWVTMCSLCALPVKTRVEIFSMNVSSPALFIRCYRH